jgi:hypothetical protein
MDVEKELNKAYRWAGKKARLSSVGWPRDALRSLVEKKLLTESMTDSDKNKISHLDRLLSTHLETLASVRLRLADFIKQNFSVEDLLYVSP